MKPENPLLRIVPRPAQVEAFGGSFAFSEKTSLLFAPDDAVLEGIARDFAANVSLLAGIEVFTGDDGQSRGGAQIHMVLEETNLELTKGGYRLLIESERVEIRAASPEGLFWGCQTLLQLILVSLDGGSCLLPTGRITDRPRFMYRSMMLDVARHFFSVEDIKRVIDLLAVYKFNHLHLHLTDDQGWRIEIKSWPALTEIGGSTQVGGGPGGYYSQADYSEIIAYAQRKFMTIVPEIDLPGHTNAALASYPDLNCSGDAPDLYTGTEVGFSSLCLEKPLTIKFLLEVIGEIAALSPGPYLHIGGDEAKSTQPADYRRFINEIQHIAAANKKEIIGWQEISQADLRAGTLVQYWTDKAELAPLPDGVRLILSPARHTYMAMKYNADCTLGLQWAGFVNLRDAYDWHPETYALELGVPEKMIAGLEAPLWSETLESIADIEYMMFPRLLAYSELGWSVDGGGDFSEFCQRIAGQRKLFESFGVNYYPSKLVDWGA